MPVTAMPSKHLFAEYRDDDQSETARQLEKMRLVANAWTEVDLPALIYLAVASPGEARPARQRCTELIEYLRSRLRNVRGK